MYEKNYKEGCFFTNEFTLLDKKIFALLLFPYLLQLIYSFFNDSYIDVAVCYTFFFLSLVAFLFSNRKVRIDISTLYLRSNNLKFIKFVFFILLLFKCFQFFKVFSSGIDYTQIRHFYFNSEDRFSALYMNSKILLYIMFYIYPSVILFLFLNSLFEKKNVFLWSTIFLLDGVLTAGRFNIYIMIICFVFMFKPNLFKLAFILLPVLFVSGYIQLLRGDAGFQLADSLLSIVHYHVAPVAIFKDGLNSEFVTSIPGDIIFSGMFFLLKPVLGGGYIWLDIQDHLQNNWVQLIGTDKEYNAFGNILLFSYWDFLYIGPIFLGFIFSFVLRIRVSHLDPSKILLVWVAVMIYFSSLKMKMFSPEFVVFLVIYLFVYRMSLAKTRLS